MKGARQASQSGQEHRARSRLIRSQTTRCMQMGIERTWHYWRLSHEATVGRRGGHCHCKCHFALVAGAGAWCHVSAVPLSDRREALEPQDIYRLTFPRHDQSCPGAGSGRAPLVCPSLQHRHFRGLGGAWEQWQRALAATQVLRVGLARQLCVRVARSASAATAALSPCPRASLLTHMCSDRDCPPFHTLHCGKGYEERKYWLDGKPQLCWWEYMQHVVRVSGRRMAHYL